jgi:hypothetical protein
MAATDACTPVPCCAHSTHEQGSRVLTYYIDVASWRRALHHASHHDGRLAGEDLICVCAVRINTDLHQLRLSWMPRPAHVPYVSRRKAPCS